MGNRRSAQATLLTRMSSRPKINVGRIDRVGEARVPGLSLGERLMAKVGERGLLGGVRDAELDEPANAGGARRSKQHARVLEHRLPGHSSARKPNPVGVVERRHAVEVTGKCGLVVEAERAESDLIAQGMPRVRPARESLYRLAARKQASGNVAAGIREGACDDVQAGQPRAVSG
jgi:hypothetical protein